MEAFLGLIADTKMLTTTVLAEAGEGFALNLNLLDTNLVNLAIIIGLLVYFGRGFLGKTLSERRSQIETAIKDAEERKRKAAVALAEQQQKLAQAEAEAERLKAEAAASAQRVRESILAQADEDIERMRAATAQDVASQQDKIIRELRQRVATMALQKVEEQLQSGLSDRAQQELIDRSIAMLGGRG
jgi:F-type H+-transporting ATPase subunit b